MACPTASSVAVAWMALLRMRMTPTAMTRSSFTGECPGSRGGCGTAPCARSGHVGHVGGHDDRAIHLVALHRETLEQVRPPLGVDHLPVGIGGVGHLEVVRERQHAPAALCRVRDRPRVRLDAREGLARVDVRAGRVAAVREREHQHGQGSGGDQLAHGHPPRAFDAVGRGDVSGGAPLAWRLPVVHDELSMAAIDGLLALVEIQKASGLVLVTGEVPALLVGGATRPLSMPALAPALFDALIDELLDPEQRERLRAQAIVELVYRSNRNNKSFNVTAQSTGERT